MVNRTEWWPCTPEETHTPHSTTHHERIPNEDVNGGGAHVVNMTAVCWIAVYLPHLPYTECSVVWSWRRSQPAQRQENTRRRDLMGVVNLSPQQPNNMVAVKLRSSSTASMAQLHTVIHI